MKKQEYLKKLEALDEIVLERLASLASDANAISWFKISHKWLAVKAVLKLKN